jgi:hypothetical protein
MGQSSHEHFFVPGMLLLFIDSDQHHYSSFKYDQGINVVMTEGKCMNSLLKSNAGKVDRIIRVIVGVLLVGNVFTGLQSPIGWVGLVLIVTGAFGTCPVYSLLGINTKSLGEKAGLK